MRRRDRRGPFVRTELHVGLRTRHGVTGEVGKLSQPGGPLYQIEHSNNGLISFPGGVPIKTSDGTVIGAVGVLAYSAGYSRAENKKESRIYELRTYTTEPGRLPALNARFKNHTMRLFEKHGMENLGYWVPLDNKDNKLVYILAYPSKEAREASWKAFMADPDWQKARTESEKNGKLTDKVESVILGATDYSPIK